VETPPWGLAGGAPARGARFYHVHDAQRDRLGSKVRVRLHQGDRLVIETSGGGGWGAPFERDPSSVAADVGEGLVSRERAALAYGVILNEDGTVNAEATRLARR
jgi:N-methylhydantoinase B